MIILEENAQLTKLNEMFVSVQNSLPTEVENSIYYSKLKALLHPEIYNFCKEQLELKSDLNFLRMSVGETITESEIRDYLNGLKQKYNDQDNNVGIDYHIESTRIDYGVSVFCVIKRDKIYMKKFVFRFRKSNISDGIGQLSNAQIIKEALKTKEQKRKERYNKLMGGE